MTNAALNQFSFSKTRRRIDDFLFESGEKPLSGDDELSIARLAYNTRLRETLVPVGPNLIAFLALGLAVFTVKNLSVLQGMLLVGLAAVGGFWVNYVLSSRAGQAASAQAIAEHRRSIELATPPNQPARSLTAAAVGSVAIATATLAMVALRRH